MGRIFDVDPIPGMCVDEIRLARMEELCGPFPESMVVNAPNRGRFFTHDGKLCPFGTLAYIELTVYMQDASQTQSSTMSLVRGIYASASYALAQTGQKRMSLRQKDSCGDA